MLSSRVNYLKKAAVEHVHALDESDDEVGSNPAAMIFDASLGKINHEELSKSGKTFRDVLKEEEKLTKWTRAGSLFVPRTVVIVKNSSSCSMSSEDQPEENDELTSAKSKPIPIPPRAK